MCYGAQLIYMHPPHDFLLFLLNLACMQAHARAGSAAFEKRGGYFMARSSAACPPSPVFHRVNVHAGYAFAVTGDFRSSQACAAFFSCFKKYALARCSADSSLHAPFVLKRIVNRACRSSGLKHALFDSCGCRLAPLVATAARVCVTPRCFESNASHV